MADLIATTTLVSAVSLATPLAFTAIGELMSERSGVLNVGLEGMMLAGAFGAVLGSEVAGSPVIGACAGAACGSSLGLLHAAVTQSLRGNQIVSGIAINIIALGFTGLGARAIWGIEERPSPATFGDIPLPLLSDLPVIGEALFRQSALVYLLGVVVIAVAFILYRTRWGLDIRACGESDVVARAAGIDVIRARYAVVSVTGALAGLGGAYIAIVSVGTFQEGMTGGRGFIALAAVIFARWIPWRAVGAALLFGVAEAVAFRLQATTSDVPFQLLNALPFLVTLVLFATVVGRERPPAALGLAPEKF